MDGKEFVISVFYLQMISSSYTWININLLYFYKILKHKYDIKIIFHAISKDCLSIIIFYYCNKLLYINKYYIID